MTARFRSDNLTSPQDRDDTSVSVLAQCWRFADFMTATASGQTAAVSDAINMYGSDYKPSHDFYRAIHTAIRDDIAFGFDEAKLDDVVRRANPKKRDHYRELAISWTTWRPKDSLTLTQEFGTWTEGNLFLRVAPTFLVTKPKHPSVVCCYYKQALLSVDAAQAITRIMEQSLLSALGRPVVLDIRRHKLHLATAHRRKNFDTWIAGQAAAFTTMDASIMKAA